jgi:hypothetical protein
MMIDYFIYVNGLFYTHLVAASVYGDRPESYRAHEKQLWTLLQIIKAGENELTAVHQPTQTQEKISTVAAFEQWIQKEYPSFAAQIAANELMRFPHPSDKLG